jgi:WD40 repeat protein
MKPSTRIETPHRINAIALSADGTQILAAGPHGVVSLWNIADRSLVKYLKGSRDDSTCVAISPDNTWVAVGGIEGDVQLFDLAKGSVARSYGQHGSRLQGVAFSPDGSLLASTCWDGHLRVWPVNADPKALKETLTQPATPIGMGGLCFSADALSIMTPAMYQPFPGDPATSFAAPITSFSITGQAPSTYFVGPATFWTLAKQGNKIAAGTDSGLVTIWSLASPSAPAAQWSILPKDHSSIARGIVKIAWCPLDDQIFAISMSGHGGIFDGKGNPIMTIDRPTDGFVAADLRAGKIALTSWNKTIEIFDIPQP